MANYQNFSITALGAATITAPILKIEVSVEDDAGTVLADRTGENAILWPTDLAGLDADTQRAILDQVVYQLIGALTGVGS